MAITMSSFAATENDINLRSMRNMKLAHRLALVLAPIAAAPLATNALAWGASGHRMISSMAAERFPEELPAFLRTQDMPFTLGELGRELDRSKGSGTTHDRELDPGHYISLDDAGRVLGGPVLDDLPVTREDYDTLLRENGKTQYEAGYLYYSIISGWQQLKKHFGYWRALVAAEKSASDPAVAARFARDRQIREMLIVRDLGVWSHYVGDASQPLHVSAHYVGWGDGPDPQGFTKSMHSDFGGEFIRRSISEAGVASRVQPPSNGQKNIQDRTRAYLKTTLSQVIPLYEIEKEHGYAHASEPAKDFVAERLAAAVAELRDLVLTAWEESDDVPLGWPETTLEAIRSGADPSNSFFAED